MNSRGLLPIHLRGRFNAERGEVNLEEFDITEEELKAVEKIFHRGLRHFLSCGTYRQIYD